MSNTIDKINASSVVQEIDSTKNDKALKFKDNLDFTGSVNFNENSQVKHHSSLEDVEANTLVFDEEIIKAKFEQKLSKIEKNKSSLNTKEKNSLQANLSSKDIRQIYEFIGDLDICRGELEDILVKLNKKETSNRTVLLRDNQVSQLSEVLDKLKVKIDEDKSKNINIPQLKELESLYNKLDPLLDSADKNIKERKSTAIETKVVIDSSREVVKSLLSKTAEIKDTHLKASIEKIVAWYLNAEDSLPTNIIKSQFMNKLLQELDKQPSSPEKLKGMLEKFYNVYDKIILTYEKDIPSEQKLQEITDIIQVNADVISPTIKLKSNHPFELLKLIKDGIAHPELYKDFTPSSVSNVGNRAKSEILTVYTPALGIPEGKMTMASAFTGETETKPHLTPSSSPEVSHIAKVSVFGGASGGARAGLRHLKQACEEFLKVDGHNFDKNIQIIRPVIKAVRRDFDINLGQLYTNANKIMALNLAYIRINQQLLEGDYLNKLNDLLKEINQSTKDAMNKIDEQSKILSDMDKDIESLIAKAEELQFLMNLELEDMPDIIDLLEKFSEIINELDDEMKKLKNRTDLKTSIDFKFLDRMKESKDWWDKLDKIRETINKTFKASSEISDIKVSTRAARAKLKSDFKILGATIQEFVAINKTLGFN